MNTKEPTVLGVCSAPLQFVESMLTLALSVASKGVFRDQWVHELQEQIANFLLEPSSKEWLGLPSSPAGTKLLDYACGDGLPSRTLKPQIELCVGVDVSAGMLEKYNENARRLGLEKSMIGVRGDLLSEPAEETDPPLSEEMLSNFDVVVTNMALHHMEDVAAAMRKLAARARPGGVVLIVDWARMDGSTPAQKDFLQAVESGEVAHVPSHASGQGQGEEDTNQNQPHHHHHHGATTKQEVHTPHPASHTISHSSFTEQQMTDLFHQASCDDVRWKLADNLSNVPGARLGKAQLFFARGIRGG